MTAWWRRTPPPDDDRFDGPVLPDVEPDPGEIVVDAQAESTAAVDMASEPFPAEDPEQEPAVGVSFLADPAGVSETLPAPRVRLRSAIFRRHSSTDTALAPALDESWTVEGSLPGDRPEPEPETVPVPDDYTLASVAAHGRRRRFGRQRRVASPAPERPPRSEAGGRLTAVVVRGGRTALTVLLIVVVLMGSLWGLALGINAFARWNARRIATRNTPVTATSQNLLIIGVRDGAAIGFTALKVERDTKRVLGIAIPEGAFVEVPGQGFERIGVSYGSGPAVSEATVSNYFGVAFTKYVVIDGAAYQALLQDQNIGAIADKVVATDLSAGERSSLMTFLKGTAAGDVWIVPLPLKAMTAGTERYFEPQRSQVADLLLKWWGVRADQQKTRPRVIVYNGVGTSGLASVAAQQLIRAGFQVVDSGNADRFGYTTTTILVYHAPTEAQAVRAALGVGAVQMQSAPQEITDMIVILGADYLPPVSVPSTVPTQGAQ
jgi:hypothetical protein